MKHPFSKKLVSIAVASLMFWTLLPVSQTLADVEGEGKVSFYYVFHLYFDAGQLYADRDFQFSYDIIPGEYTDQTLTTNFPYRGEVIDFTGTVAGRFVFDPRNGNDNFTKGKVSVQAPYVSDGANVVFYDSQNKSVLTISVGESSFCNDDGICNAEHGEDYANCSKDCKAVVRPAPPADGNTDSDTGSGATVLGIIYTVIGLVLLIALWWFFKRKPKNDQPSLPTPPAPPNSPNNI